MVHQVQYSGYYSQGVTKEWEMVSAPGSWSSFGIQGHWIGVLENEWRVISGLDIKTEVKL
jgi:hypothetical protein